MMNLGRIAAGILIAVALSAAAAAQDSVPDTTPKPGAPAKQGAVAGKANAAPSEQPAGEPPAPIYEDKLLRLSEILGSLSFLRDLCGDSDGAAWRDEMNALLSAEAPPPQRRTRLVARFNHGFETFNAVYRVCTPSAQLAISRYLVEGAALTEDVRGRYSQ